MLAAPIFVEREQERDPKLLNGEERFWGSQRPPRFLKFYIKIMR